MQIKKNLLYFILLWIEDPGIQKTIHTSIYLEI